jgi:hypothetical protein
MSDEDDAGVVISGYATLTIRVSLESVTDDDSYGVADLCQHKHRTVIPDPHVGKGINPDRFLSAGYIFGMELARVANKFRDAVADDCDIAAGFAREMQDWDKDHGVTRKKEVSDG